MTQMTRWALFSPDRRYRYELGRRWDHTRPLCAWVLHNPSKAGEKDDDPTVRKVIGFTQRWGGFGGVVLVSPFALVATYPKELLVAADPVGPDNVAHVRRNLASASVSRVVVAWGVVRQALRQALRAISRDRVIDARVVCLGRTKEGFPRHPGRIGYDTPVEPWSWR